MKTPSEILKESEREFDEIAKQTTLYLEENFATKTEAEIKSHLTSLTIKLLEGEIERLRGERFEKLSPLEKAEHEDCNHKKNGLYVGDVAGSNYNKAIMEQCRYLESQLSEIKQNNE